MSELLRIAVDPGNVLAREFTALEQMNLSFAVMQAANATAFGVRQHWAETMPRVFDRPTALTLKAVLVSKATKARPAATVYLRDEAFKGTPPAKYLLAQVTGGVRRHKAFEKRLMDAGVLPRGMFAVPGKGATLDAFGNLSGGTINALLSQLRARSDSAQNETAESAARRRRRQAKRGERAGDYFAAKTSGHLPAGVYQRVSTGFGSAIKSILHFVRPPSYTVRYEIFGLAERVYRQQFPFHFENELSKAVQTSKFRGQG